MPNYKRVFADNHYIFITVVTFKRNPILTENIELLRESFKKTQSKYNYEIFGIVILPDHFHMILKPANIDEYPKIISLIKWHFAWNIDDRYIMKNQLSQSNIKRKEKGIWQRRYYEHTIRNEESLYKHLDYIHFNPVKHNHIKNVKDWKFSSFYKFVNKGFYDINWGNMENIKHIQDLELE